MKIKKYWIVVFVVVVAVGVALIAGKDSLFKGSFTLPKSSACSAYDFKCLIKDTVNQISYTQKFIKQWENSIVQLKKDLETQQEYIEKLKTALEQKQKGYDNNIVKLSAMDKDLNAARQRLKDLQASLEVLQRKAAMEKFQDERTETVTTQLPVATQQPQQPADQCAGPYHVRNTAGYCVWSCGEGTVPDSVSNQCKCRDGYAETGTDTFGRRRCAWQPVAPAPKPLSFTEDCISYNPQTLKVEQDPPGTGAWYLKRADGGYIKEFPSMSEAATAHNIIVNYNLREQCFIGRGVLQNPVSYWLTQGHAAPTGNRLAGREDCLSRDLSKAFVPKADTVGSPSSVRIQMYGNNRALYTVATVGTYDAAKKLIEAWKAYGFNNMCYVGSPDPSMIYYKVR